jgi:MFS family permease
VLCGGIVMGCALGVRHVQGLFLLPMTTDRGWSREEFAFAIALQNLIWGLAQPFTGMVADRFGSLRVLFAGCLLYGIGLYLMAHAATSTELVLSAGVLIGLALSATAFGTVYGAISRIVAPSERSWALGLTGAIGGVGQFAMVPAAQGLIGGVGWMAALAILAMAMMLLFPLSFPLNDREQILHARQESQSLSQAIREALSHRGFWLLNVGFLACGFQLAFIATHFPAYLLDKGLSGANAVLALSLIALSNIAGTFLCGHLGGRYRRKHVLAILYLLRSAAMLLFVLLPVTATTVYLFSLAMGLLWLGTLPLTNGLISQVFGVKYLSTIFGFVFVGHQLGSFLGVWLGGVIFDMTRSYDLIWFGAILLGLVAAALHWPIDDRQLARLQPA